MHKKALFLLKNGKDRPVLGLRPQTPLPPAAGGFSLRPPASGCPQISIGHRRPVVRPPNSPNLNWEILATSLGWTI